jgi:hypothetical protein
MMQLFLCVHTVAVGEASGAGVLELPKQKQNEKH